MESLAALYKNHIVTLQERTRDALERFKRKCVTYSLRRTC